MDSQDQEGETPSKIENFKKLIYLNILMTRSLKK
jgi:hypothetical protein